MIMSENSVSVPRAVNEPVKEYLPGSPEREELKTALDEIYSNVKEIPMFIGGKEVRSNKILPVYPPHKIGHKIGEYHQGSAEHVNMAIGAALAARESWANMCWKQRAAIFLRAASLLAGPYRAKINAATMIGQSKTVHQAEIDSACEIIDFLRFNVQFMEEIYNRQPDSSKNVWNRI
jgi:1-pyrroline-5-carboxylate dehydrogenase